MRCSRGLKVLVGSPSFDTTLILNKTYGRLERLLDDFQWGRMDEIFLDGQD